ncbi:MAG: NUDIX domain-containing protein [Candidatus Yanofskybacteria bacterium]|nr:NUDIX domain-containing protein [Candidatus Yanofskybacteria bacterium]
MAKDRNKAVPASYLVLRKDDEVLLARRFNTGYYDGHYSLPAGHVEAGELPLDALVREIQEEVGVRIESENLCLAHIMYRTKRDETGDRTDFFFTASKYEGEIENKEPHKCADLQWFPLAQLPESIIPHIKDVLLNIEKGIIYSELGLE